jgi:hypothetical protein
MSGHDDLRAKAEAATPGPWAAARENVNEMQGLSVRDMPVLRTTDGTFYGMRAEDYEFIAAVSPDVVLRLLDDLAAANNRADRAEKLLADIRSMADDGDAAYAELIAEKGERRVKRQIPEAVIPVLDLRLVLDADTAPGGDPEGATND